ncbi:MAG: glycosyltransferase family 4 protein [Pseudolabrys sp.]
MKRPRLLYLVTEDWYFMTHRLPMARAARDAGYDVHVATRVSKFADRIAAEGFTLHEIDLYRGSVNPLSFARAVSAVRTLCRAIAPDVVHHIALQPSIIGALAARGAPYAVLNSIFGFGSVFTAHGLKSRFARLLLRPLIPLLFNAKRSMTMVVNPDHRDMLVSLGVDAGKIAVIPGSGVDLTKYGPLPEPQGAVTLGYAGRMLEDKGVRVLVEACERLARDGHDIRLLLAGLPDPSNPNSIPQSELEAWSRQPGIEWLGNVEDVRTVWARAHVAVLASRGEGMPMSLAEAAACERPLIATDVSGCREIARDNLNALLVSPDDAAALAAAIARLSHDAALRQRLGKAGRRLVEQDYASERVAEKIVAIYRQLSDAQTAH